MKNLLKSRVSKGNRSSFLFILIFSFLVIIQYNGCKKSSDDEDNSATDPTSIEGSENLGSGYDVFENYADATKVKAPILDLSQLNSAGLIELKTIENSTFSTSSGTTIDEYSSSLKVSASLSGSYMYFSGAIKTNFHEDRYEYESYSFATVKSLIQKFQLRLPTDMTAEDFKPYLTATAKSKINDPAISSDYIFSTYGTHCITGVILGGRLDYSVSAKTSDLATGKGIDVYAEASFGKGGVSVTGSGGVVTEEEYNTFMNSQKKILHVYGGQSEFGQDIINKDDYDLWIGSIKDNSVFCNFTQNGLIPVWEFCDDEIRKNELMTAFDAWAADREIIVNPTPPEPRLCILDVRVYYGQNVADPLFDPTNGKTYHRLWADCNAGSGGGFVWIYYCLGYENEGTPVSHICTIDQTDGESLAALGPGWVQLTGDLNHGAGGDLIYVAIKPISNTTDPLLTGLRIELNAKTENVYSLYTNESNNWFAVNEGGPNGINKQDLNEGCGGWYNYLYFTFDLITEE